jgi:N-dimethylarginine dimethylaminohydrolase
MRLLMCAPDHFDVVYEINAWMRVTRAPDQALAREQWRALHRILTEDVGADVSLIPQVASLPDMVFTANAGIVQGQDFVPARLRYAERQGETDHFIRWFQGNGYTVRHIPKDVIGTFEGEGDALFHGDLLLAGHGWRSDEPAHKAIGELFGREVIPLGLIDTRWYHLDTCLVPLASDLLAYYPGAFDEHSRSVIAGLPGDKIAVSEHDALRFACNAVVVGRHVVLNAGCAAFEADLAARGFEPHATDLSEFLKAGGAAKCLALVLTH